MFFPVTRPRVRSLAYDGLSAGRDFTHPRSARYCDISVISSADVVREAAQWESCDQPPGRSGGNLHHSESGVVGWAPSLRGAVGMAPRALTVAMVSASEAGLSSRYRRTRAKRRATPPG